MRDDRLLLTEKAVIVKKATSQPRFTIRDFFDARLFVLAFSMFTVKILYYRSVPVASSTTVATVCRYQNTLHGKPANRSKTEETNTTI